MPAKAATLVVNPAAGGLLDGAVTPEGLAARLTAAGFAVELLSGPPGEIRQRVERARDLPADLVVVAGGDGTINAAAQVLAGSGKILGLIPRGTLNHLSKDLGIPQDLDGAVEALSTGVVREIDIGDVNGHLFLCSSVIGFASRLGGQRERWRGRLHPWRWLRLIVRIAQTLYRDPTLEVGFSGTTRPALRTRYLVVAVGLYEEAPGQLFARSHLDSGEFGVYAVRRPTFGRLARIMLAALMGRWRQAPDLIASEAGTLTVTSSRPRLRVMNDGEAALLDVPLRYSLRAQALRVLGPRIDDVDSGGAADPAPNPDQTRLERA